MKYVFIILCFLLPVNGLAGSVLLPGSGLGSLIAQEWIGSGGEYLEVDSFSAFLSIGYRHRKCFVEYRDNMLILAGKPANGIVETADHTDDEEFKVLQLTWDTLILQADNTNAVKVFQTDARMVFVSRAHFFSLPLHFQKLNYTCSGDGVEGKIKQIKIQIDSTGALKFSNKKNVNGDDEFTTSQLNKPQLDSLVYLLKNSALDKFIMPRASWNRNYAPVYTFRFAYNNKETIAGGQVIPYYGVGLKKFLDGIGSSVESK